MTYKGFPGYMPIVGHLAENGLIVRDEFGESNESPAARNRAFIKYRIRQMPTGKKISALRSDSAAYQVEIINYCEGHGIQFTIGADLYQATVGAIRAIPEKEWNPYQSGYIAETIHAMERTNTAFRLIIIRKPYQSTLFAHEETSLKYTAIAT
jgi:hypothetical protein